MVLLLASLSVVGLAGAAGVGTFSIEQNKSADVGQIGVVTLYMDNTWQPLADDVWLNVTWDGAVLGYISTDWKVGNSVSATLAGTNTLFLQMADFTNNYPNGKVAIADINFKALAAGSSPLTVEVGHVRSHDAAGNLDPALVPFGELTASAITTPGTFAVGGGAVTTAPTVAPTATVDGNVTVVPTATVDGNVTVVPTVDGNVTVVPTIVPTSANGVPVGNPKQILRAGDTVFIGEYGLDLTALGVADGTTLGWFQAGSNVATSSPDDTLIVSSAANFNVVPGTRAGAWYNLNNNRALAINVKDPSLNVRVWDVQSNKDVTGKTVTEGRLLSFRIDSNLDSVYSQRGTAAGVTIKVRSPEGNVYSALIDNTGSLNSLVVPVTSSSMLVAGKGANASMWDTGNANYRTGEFKVWAESNLNGMKDNYKDPSGADYTGKTITSQYAVTIGQDVLEIVANTDVAVVRNNDFAVTITGRPAQAYNLWLASTGDMGGAGNQPPMIKEGQTGVNLGAAAAANYTFDTTQRTIAEDVPALENATNPWYAVVTTDDNGKRTIGFSTDANTDDKTYTIRVQWTDPATGNFKYDTVDVEVVKGTVTIRTSGNESFFLGEEITLSGENTDSDRIHLFVTGPNLPSAGANLADLLPVVEGDAASFTTENVDADNTWEYKWNTANLNVDAGSYTIYAIATPNNRDNLRSAKYATASLIIRKPFVTANASAATVAKGDELKFTGVAEGKPSNLAVWLFGTNLYLADSATVKDDSTYTYTVSRGTTQNLATGQYFAVVQHPMYNGQFDVAEVVEGGVTRVYDTSGNFFIAAGPGRLQGSDAANALVNLINGANIDDTYTKLSFVVEEARISIAEIGDRNVGDTFDVTGTTNLAPGDNLLVTITSSSFEPTDKSQAGGFSGISGSTQVVRGTDGNTFNFTVDASQFQPDAYDVKVESVEAASSATETFNVVEGGAVTVAPTATPDANVTATVTGTAATVVTTAANGNGTATATPTPTPGFGAVVALVGLGAVAVLVLRRE
jgi:trimeric autotransporter adhesin